ncbi:hypothetical protein F4778DRAFT_630243 [Xylariomycetidae sp. FL2044]|nr:hypothetical protein F4778DRAFT_630243 [Xylariomycetidae sp. FL2044]
MGTSSGIAGLKCLQWIFRGLQFGCSVIVLGIWAYFLAAMVGHRIDISPGTKAVVGISGAGVLYTICGLLFICCCAGHPAPSFVSMVLDIGLAAAFIYVAIANRDGAGSCTSGTVHTVFGSGNSDDTAGDGGDGSVTNIPSAAKTAGLPTFRLACQLEMVCLIVACVAILFFLISVLLEIHMNRSRYRASRPIRDPDGEYINKSDHIGAAPPQRRHGGGGFFGFRRGAGAGMGLGGNHGPPPDPDMLPVQPGVGDFQTRQVEVPPTWGEVSSLHDSDRLYFNEGEDRDQHGPPVRIKSTTAARPAAEEYQEGDTGGETTRMYQEDEHGNDHSEVGRNSKHRMSREARLERQLAM